MNERLVAWAAVAVQFVALAGIVLSPGDPGSVPDWLQALGLVLMTVGVVVMLAAFLNLGSALTPTPVPVPGAGLRTSGLYSRIRHPIYTGLMTLGAGLVLRSPGPWRWVWLAVLVAVLVAKSVWEERMLSAAYPQYQEYRASTGRFLPRLRRGPLK